MKNCETQGRAEIGCAGCPREDRIRSQVPRCPDAGKRCPQWHCIRHESAVSARPGVSNVLSFTTLIWPALQANPIQLSNNPRYTNDDVFTGWYSFSDTARTYSPSPLTHNLGFSSLTLSYLDSAQNSTSCSRLLANMRATWASLP